MDNSFLYYCLYCFKVEKINISLIDLKALFFFYDLVIFYLTLSLVFFVFFLCGILNVNPVFFFFATVNLSQPHLLHNLFLTPNLKNLFCIVLRCSFWDPLSVLLIYISILSEYHAILSIMLYHILWDMV